MNLICVRESESEVKSPRVLQLLLSIVRDVPQWVWSALQTSQILYFLFVSLYPLKYTSQTTQTPVYHSQYSGTKLFPRLRECVVKDGDDDDGAAVLSYRLKLKTILSRDSRFQYNVQCIYQELPKLSRTWIKHAICKTRKINIFLFLTLFVLVATVWE